MNREIKFKSWDYEHQKMIKRPVTNWEDGDINFNLQDDDYEWLQYVGLKDLNGIDIYEGDIVRRRINSNGKLYTSNYKTNIRVVEIKNGRVNLEYKDKIRWEVIGNIYENPNLIK